jgi:hypothetical protein
MSAFDPLRTLPRSDNLTLMRLLAEASHRAELAGRPYSNRDTFNAIYALGIVPWALVESEMAAGAPAR